MTPQELKNSILQLAIQGKLVEQRADEGTGAELLEKILAAKNAEDAKGRGNKLTHIPRAKRVCEADALAGVSRGVRGGGEAGELFNLPKAAKSHHGKLSALSASPRGKIPDDEKPFDIPESWEWVRLGDICAKVVDGDHNPPSGVSKKTNYLMLSAQNIGVNGLSNLDQVRYLSEDIYLRENERTKVRIGDLFLTIVGTLGRCCVYEGGYNICFQRSVAVITALIYNYYLKNVFDSYFVQQFMAVNATGTAQKGFYLKQLERLPIPLPPLAEQKRIVAKIEELLPLIDRYEKAWSKLEDFNKRFPVDMQKSLLQMAIQGKLVEQREDEGTGAELLEKILAAKNAEGAKGKGEKSHAKSAKSAKVGSCVSREEIPDDEKPFDIPESWEWARLGEIMLDVSTGPFGSMLHKADYCDGDIPLVNPMNIQNGRIVPSDKMRVSTKTAERLSAYRLSKGMIVVARRGELGRCASVGDEQDGWLCGTGSFFLDPSKDIFVPFITLIISSPYARQLFAGKAIGTTMANLNHNLLKALPIPLPPLAEQKRIVAKLKELLPLCERLK